MKKVLVFICVLLVLVAVGSFAQKHQIKNNTITIAWIPKALNNPVFEIGRVGALKKAEELTAKGPYKVEIVYVASVASDIAEQAAVMEDVIAKGVDAIGISCNDPTGCVDPIEKAHRGRHRGHDLGLRLARRAAASPTSAWTTTRAARQRPTCSCEPWATRARSPC